MGSIYKPRIYIPLPEGAEVFEAQDAKGKTRKFARWRDAKGKAHKGRLSRNGDKVAVGESPKWSIAFDDYDPETGRPRRREISGIGDVAIARELLRKKEIEAEKRKRGLIDPLEEALARNERLPIEDHLDAFSGVLEGSASTRRHVETTLTYVRHLCAACGFETPADIGAAKVSGYVADLREGRVSIRKFKTARTTSHRTINATLTAAKRFSRWLYVDKRLRRDPLAEIRKLNTKTDRRHERRALADDEIDRLVAAAGSGPPVLGICGRDRAMVYRLALGTGLRASELGSLKPESFDLADPASATVSVEAAYSKHREPDTLPLRRDLAEAVGAHIAGRPAGELIFRLPQKTAAMLRADLEAAGIPYRDAAGHVADFHALRHTFITRLARSGIAPSVAKDLARHSSIVLTIDHYTHTLLTEKRAALERLPSLGPAAADDSMAATGTQDARPAESLRRDQRACP